MTDNKNLLIAAGVWLVASSALAQSEDASGLAAAAAPEDEAAVEEEAVEETPDETPVDACQASLTVGAYQIQACGTHIVVTQEGRIVRVRDLGVEPTDLFERNGAPWFAIGDQAHSLDAYTPAPPVPEPPHRSIPPPPAPTHVDVERPGMVAAPAFDGPADLDPNGRYRDRLSPERVSGVQLGLSVMPVLGSGFAIMGDAFVSVRAKRAFSARLIVDRIGHTISADDGPEFGVFDGSLVIGYDHRLFEMSFGVGLTRARIDGWTRRLSGVAPTVVMGMRFGALDGLHVEISSSLLAAEGETDFSKIAVRMQWPLGVGRWLVVRGSGSGPSGYGWGEIGMRIMTHGERGSGSLFITPSIGGGGLFNDLTFAGVTGFAMSLGIEYRP